MTIFVRKLPAGTLREREPGNAAFQRPARATRSAATPSAAGGIERSAVAAHARDRLGDWQSLGLAFTKDEHHIVCPWHGYEFDVMTGCHPFDPHVRLTPVPVRIAGGEVRLTLGGKQR
jgi:hypothetical protein